MAYNALLAERIRKILKHRRGVSEQKMFGGICFSLNGNMCCGVAKEDLVLRLGAEGVAIGLKKAHTRPFEVTGRPMKTMLCVSPEGHQDDEALKYWLNQALAFVRLLPPKKPK